MEYHHLKNQFVNYRSSRGRREREGGRELFKEITAENFPNLGRDLNI